MNTNSKIYKVRVVVNNNYDTSFLGYAGHSFMFGDKSFGRFLKQAGFIDPNHSHELIKGKLTIDISAGNGSSVISLTEIQNSVNIITPSKLSIDNWNLIMLLYNRWADLSAFNKQAIGMLESMLEEIGKGD